ncbi:hypothetical protein KEM56_003646, partial [Ascosphaera pollenicola]
MPSAVQVDAGQQADVPTSENGVKGAVAAVNGDTPKTEEKDTKVEANGVKEEKKEEEIKDDDKKDEEKKKDGEDSDSDSDDEDEAAKEKKKETPKEASPFGVLKGDETITLLIDALQAEKKKRQSSGASDKKKASINDFKRVDYVWNRDEYEWELKESNDQKKDIEEGKWNEYIFLVKRNFDDDGDYENTVLQFKSKYLRDVARKVMYEDLLSDEPEIETEVAFKHLEDFRQERDDLAAQLAELEKDATTNKKTIRRAKKTIAHLETFIKYVDIDYDETKKKLYPLLKAGKITYDLLWTIFKPGELIYTPDYEGDSEPHCMKYRASSYNKCKGYFGVSGSMVKFDDDKIGMANEVSNIYGFRGTKHITQLSSYPLRYHPQQREVRRKLIERGKKYIECQGIHHRRYDGFAYLFVEERQRMMKMNVSGRIMVDFVNFKKNMPNYYDLNLDARDGDLEMQRKKGEEDMTNHMFAVIKTKAGLHHVAKIETDEEGNETTPECQIAEEDIDPMYKNVRICEDELLLCSPVVYGFSFSQKMWIEFAVSKLEEVVFTPEAFHSLVIPESQKSIIKALVRSHTVDVNRNIDDIIAGKGQGLVSVLHGPPGVGKTLTAEGIAELVRRPLYSVSVGELGTSTNRLEENLKTILDVAHAWGAVLLLDEAD